MAQAAVSVIGLGIMGSATDRKIYSTLAARHGDANPYAPQPWRGGAQLRLCRIARHY
jgi:hypothetical protein